LDVFGDNFKLFVVVLVRGNCVKHSMNVTVSDVLGVTLMKFCLI
jgi:hypothetical protein